VSDDRPDRLHLPVDRDYASSAISVTGKLRDIRVFKFGQAKPLSSGISYNVSAPGAVRGSRKSDVYLATKPDALRSERMGAIYSVIVHAPKVSFTVLPGVARIMQRVQKITCVPIIMHDVGDTWLLYKL